MSTIKKIIFGVILLAVVAASGIHFLGLPHTVRAGTNPAPKFTVTNMQGQTVTLDSLKGKPIFINFWATWCPPCVAEMPDIQKMYDKYGDRVHFVIINADGAKDDVQSFMQKNTYTFPVMLDTDNSAARAYSIQAIPMSGIIDADGNLLDTKIGALHSEAMESFIASAL